MSELIVLFNGFSTMNGENQMDANCSCTLIKGTHNIIIDTMTAWDGEKIIAALQKHEVTPEMIDYVISTHGHSDHIGNNNLFLKAKHIVGFSISYKEQYFIHPFDTGDEYIINNSVKVIPTPGHTLSDVTVLVDTIDGDTVAVAGDLFEKFEDIANPNEWLEAGSEDPEQQRKNRFKVAALVHWIVPGHGPRFQVTDKIRESLKNQMLNLNQ
ncbi:hypothetical protein O3G_MSEX007606 [Manduca sexta]|uniref:Metallo-beta-lactamase domain-containing protein 1 n=1 Tax=Manduca sexta TaxID=7130 RepID=A0A921Z6T7_MANSE|nr:hypothetical protein O3G_MSEX007606 [Manduca sexta]